MKTWDEMSEDERDEAIARTFFGWTPVQCPGDPDKIGCDSHHRYYCAACDATTDDWAKASNLKHTIIPHLTGYTKHMSFAWKVVECITQLPKTIAESERAANTRFGYWFDAAHLWAMDEEAASESICHAALHAAGYWEQDHEQNH